MRIPWKPVLFVLANSVLAVIQVLLMLLVLAVYRGLTTGHDTGSGLGFAYLAVIPACMVFVGIGISLFVLGKFYSISLVNRLLPFLSILPFFLGTWTATLPAIAIILALLTMLEISTTVTVLVRNRGKATSEKTVEQGQSPSERGIVSFMGWGTLGFVLGALVAILPVFLLEFLRHSLGDSMLGYFQLFVSYAAMGSVGGAILGRMALNSTGKAWRLALAGGLGFALGSILSYAIGEEIPVLASGAIVGALGGAAIGRALGNWKRAISLALGGMALFAVTHRVLYNGLSYASFDWFNWLFRLPVEGAVSGAVLGAIMGYLESRRRRAGSPVPVV